MAIQFKFREDADEDRRAPVIQAVKAESVTVTVRPLFPGEDDAELASLYRVEGIDDDVQPAVLRVLNAADDVEFAEPDARRRLIR